MQMTKMAGKERLRISENCFMSGWAQQIDLQTSHRNNLQGLIVVDVGMKEGQNYCLNDFGLVKESCTPNVCYVADEANNATPKRYSAFAAIPYAQMHFPKSAVHPELYSE